MKASDQWKDYTEFKNYSSIARYQIGREPRLGEHRSAMGIKRQEPHGYYVELMLEFQLVDV